MKRINISLDPTAINPVYRPLLAAGERYLVLYGGAGSGKSYFVAQRYVLFLLSGKMCNLLCVRAVGNTHRDSTFALFRQILSSWGVSQLFKVNLSEMRITCLATGNSVIFKGLDDAEKLKSVTFEKGELTDIWIEEASEIREEDFNQLDIRLRGGSSRKQIVLSFNPVNINHWLKRRFFDCRPGNARILHSTYRDNGFLDRDYCRLLEGYRDTDPYYYSVYCLGQWGVFGGSVFNSENLQRRISELTEQECLVGLFSGGIWREEEKGYIRIYSPPREGIPYVIGCDTAGEGSDFFAAQVLDNTTGEQVAVLHMQGDETVVAQQLQELGRYYNEALIAVEANFSTYIIRKLEEWKYTKQYQRKTEDRFTHAPIKAYGFRTTALTRPLIISGLADVARENIELIRDRKTLEEMLTFVRNERGRPEAMSGAHDDLVMALAIAYYAREQQDYTPRAPKVGSAEWTEDMLEDYYSADAQGREYLLRKWGNPF